MRVGPRGALLRQRSSVDMGRLVSGADAALGVAAVPSTSSHASLCRMCSLETGAMPGRDQRMTYGLCFRAQREDAFNAKVLFTLCGVP